MPKQKARSNTAYYRLRVLALLLALGGLIGGAAIAHADQFDAQINTLSAQNASAAGVVNGLMTQAGSYQAEINQLQSQINAVQNQIGDNQAQQAKLQAQITNVQNQIDEKKQQLSATIKAMYIDGQTSTIEELASSKNLSDYVDKEEYRTAVQNQLDAKIKEIAQLQAQLQTKKQQVDQLLASEKAQNAQLGNDQTKQNQLLAYNQGQQDAYNQQISANSSQIDQLRQEQIAANARFIGGGGGGPACGGGYPGVWCNAPQDSIIDRWGMYNRECVSYTAFRVAASGRNMPYWGGRGNANQWDDNAIAAGIPVDYGSGKTNGGVRAGDIAISNAGNWGHSMYVESVNGNGTINISQYNANFQGTYSTRSGLSTYGLVFIHFR